MHLTETGMPGYFQITAEGDNFKVSGTQIHANSPAEVEDLISNLAEMLAQAKAFANNNGMVDRILHFHDLIEYKGES
jgi:hypothetical protein